MAAADWTGGQQPIKRSSSYLLLPPDMSELRVVVLGNSWSERSSVGNIILGKTVFNTEEEPTSCLEAKGQVEETNIVLINTPDLLLPNISENKLREHVEHCMSLSPPGPHLFLLVLQPEDFTEEHKLRLCRVLQLFSPRSFDHSLLLISSPKEESSASKEKDVQDEPLKYMKKKCRYRYVKMKIPEHLELLTRLGQVAKENGGAHVSCAVSEDEDAGLIMKPKSEHLSSDLNLVLCGRRGVEKTSAAKAILGRTELQSVSNSSVCVKNQGETCGHQVSVVELPALYGKPQEAVMEESLRCVSLCAPEGVHAFLLVLPVDTLTDEDKGELETLRNMFSSQVNDFTMILFNAESGPNYPAVVRSLEENKDIQELCQSCGERYVVFNMKNKRQIPELLNTVKKMRVKGSRCFTKDMFTKAQMEKVLEKENINARLKAELQDVKKKSEMRGDDEIQSRENLEMERVLKEKEEEIKSKEEAMKRKEEEMKRKEEDFRRKHEEDLTKLTRQLKEKQQEIEQERQLRAKELKERNECINKEREGRKKERAEWERSRKKLEENQRQELKRQLELSEKIIKSEKEEKEKAARQFELFRKEMKKDREAWEKERKDFWEQKSQEDKQNLEEVKMNLMKLQDEYGFKRRKWTYWCFGVMFLFISYLLYYIYTH